MLLIGDRKTLRENPIKLVTKQLTKKNSFLAVFRYKMEFRIPSTKARGTSLAQSVEYAPLVPGVKPHIGCRH